MSYKPRLSLYFFACFFYILTLKRKYLFFLFNYPIISFLFSFHIFSVSLLTHLFLLTLSVRNIISFRTNFEFNPNAAATYQIRTANRKWKPKKY